MPPTVSVITATYNYARYLGEAIESVLAQTLADWEMIVVDDGSSDNTAEVIQPYLRDKRIHYHRTENRGQPAAKNTAIRLAKGSLIAFLDAGRCVVAGEIGETSTAFRRRPKNRYDLYGAMRGQ